MLKLRCGYATTEYREKWGKLYFCNSKYKLLSEKNLVFERVTVQTEELSRIRPTFAVWKGKESLPFRTYMYSNYEHKHMNITGLLADVFCDFIMQMFYILLLSLKFCISESLNY